MRTIDSTSTAAWLSGDYSGAQRPMMRATIQTMDVLLVPVNDEVYASAVFGQQAVPVEIPNIKSIRWNRSTESDAATCELVLYNTIPLPLGTVPERDAELDLPGYYTFNHGATEWSIARWGHTPNSWQDRLVPDRIIRTFEGYGFDATLTPENDPHMYQSGLWLIDDVEYTHDGLITVTCRDFARILMDEIAFPPVVPFKKYPISFSTFHQVDNPDIVSYTTSGSVKWVRPAYQSDSGIPYVGRNGSIFGHRPSDAFDGDTSSYWMSIGNDGPRQPYSFEFIQGSLGNKTLNAIKFHVRGGPYRVYISVKIGGVWQGRHIVPYDPNNPVSAPNGADIPFVDHVTVDKGGHYEWIPNNRKHQYKNVQSIRLTFTDLFDSGVGTYQYRAMVYDVQCEVGTSTTTKHVKDGGKHWEGNYGDYTDVVKRFLAYGGFYWPDTSQQAFITNTDGTRTTLVPSPGTDASNFQGNHPYNVIEKGRVWGDFEQTATQGVADLTMDIFDKKPLMDCINYVRDVVAFNFWVDEFGGVIWRSPNIWTLGNIKDGAPTQDMTVLDERQTLIGLRAKLSSRSIREKIIVANVNGKIGAVYPAPGKSSLNPYPSGLRRVGGWTDQNFGHTSECQVMADLIAVRELLTYRTDVVTIAGYPGIQIDDQVRIYERVTNEGYVHYVKSIEANWDLESGKYTYQLETNWLGSHPFDDWVLDPGQLSSDTINYLKAIGKL